MSPTLALRAPLLWLLLPFMAGLAAADLHAPPAEAMLPVGGIALLLALAAFPSRTWWWGTAIASSSALAGWLWLPLRSPPPPAWDYPPREVEVQVMIEQIFATAPGRSTLGGLAVVVDAAAPFSELVGQRVYYSILVRASIPPVSSGHYRLRGIARRLPATPSGAGFEAYLANAGVSFEIARCHFVAEARPPTRFQRFCRGAQQRLAAILSRGVAEHTNAVSIYLGMLLGQKAQFTGEQEAAFMRTGVFHIFSISGLHVGVIAVAMQGLLQLVRVPRRVAIFAALPVLWLYVQISGGSTPAERAFLMIAFASCGKMFRLPGNPLAAISAAALLTLVVDPRQLFTAGFQMSYGVVAALIVMGSPLGARCQAWWQPWRSLPEADWTLFHRATQSAGTRIIGAVAVSGVAMLASIPPGIGYFELLSPGSVVANLIVIPLSGLSIIAGLISLMFGLCGLLPVSVFLNHAAMVAIHVMEALVRAGVHLPGMWFEARFEPAWLANPAAALVLASMFAGAALRWSPGAGGFWPPVAVVAALLALGVEFGGSAPTTTVTNSAKQLECTSDEKRVRTCDGAIGKVRPGRRQGADAGKETAPGGNRPHVSGEDRGARNLPEAAARLGARRAAVRRSGEDPAAARPRESPARGGTRRREGAGSSVRLTACGDPHRPRRRIR
jgi:competence protein ComEC